ncbi:putative phosphoglycerate mutase [Rosellinia necatrix]|uniref:Putative phosphoglycerate mutase n=1 Tax=Rosellinia necatrix TaxID=77044 RepID=A0A1W2TR94_ROSNE|nr:putative phosphoglycerate mutase [Rosellinia necatrix]
MGRPRLIIIIRHGQSEGNKNREIHQTIPDHRVKLTSDGWAQARDAGLRLRAMLRPDDTLQFYTSPYRRTRETTEGILETLTSDDPDPSPFKRSNMTIYEEPRLREQDFGNFQPCSDEMERMWQERADYGHFFYRIPNGESAADAYDRVSGFNESLWRQFSEDDFPSVLVLVTHGLMSRVFLMKWYHFSVEYFEDLRNVNHCEFLIMKKKQDSGKYILQNKLRTWSELRRERAAAKAKDDKGQGEHPDSKDAAKLDATPVVARKWGGCPEGCSHSKQFKIRRDLLELRQHDEASANASLSHGATNGNGTVASRRTLGRRQLNNSDDDSDDPRGLHPPSIDVTKARDEVVSSPDGTPSFITIEDRLRHNLTTPKKNPYLHVGRDFGGTYSGHASEEDLSENDARERLAMRAARVKNGDRAGSALNGGSKDPGTSKYSSRHVHANRLGDAPSNSDQGSDGSYEVEEDLDKAEQADKSVRGSVY